MHISRLLIGLGLALLLAGLIWPVLAKLGLGRLPGDIMIRRDGFSLYVPLMTSLVVSALLSFVLWLSSR